MRILGFVTGETSAGDSSKVIVKGKAYEGTEEVYDYLKKENVIGYKLFVIYDVVHRIPIYFEVRGINEADAPSLKWMVERAEEITGKSIKRLYIDRRFYDEENFVWLDKKKHVEYVTRGKKGTNIFEQAAELGEDKFKEVMLKTKEYEPKTASGKAAKNKRNEKKMPVRIAECSYSFSDGSTVRVVVEKKRTRLSKRDKLLLLLEKLSGSYTAQEILDLYKKGYGMVFSNSKKPAITITKALKKIPQIEAVGKGRGRKYRI